MFLTGSFHLEEMTGILLAQGLLQTCQVGCFFLNLSVYIFFETGIDFLTPLCVL